MIGQVPRHLSKKPLIAGLEPIELLGVAALLVGSNVAAKLFSIGGSGPAVVSASAFLFFKFAKRGKAKGHLQHFLQFQFRNRVRAATIQARGSNEI